MDWIRSWIRNLGIKLYTFGTTKEEEQLWYLQKRAGEAELFYRKYRSAIDELDQLEQSLAEPPVVKAKPAPKKRKPRKQ